MIERIEVLKGPASALYGSDGVGGVVQVFTRKGREGFHPNAVGHRRQLRLPAAAAPASPRGQGPLTYSLGVQRERERGFSRPTLRAALRQLQPRPRPVPAGLAVNGSARLRLRRRLEARRRPAVRRRREPLRRGGPDVDRRSAVRALVAQAGVRGRVTSGWTSELRCRAAPTPPTRWSRSRSTSGAFRPSSASGPGRTTSRRRWARPCSGWSSASRRSAAQHRLPGDRARHQLGLRGPQRQRRPPQLAGQRAARPQLAVRQRRHLVRGLRLAHPPSLARPRARTAPASWRLRSTSSTSPASAIRPAARGGQQHRPGRHLDARPATRSSWCASTTASAASSPTRPTVRPQPTCRAPASTAGRWATTGRSDAPGAARRARAARPAQRVHRPALPRRASSRSTLGADYAVGAWRFGGSLLTVGRSLRRRGQHAPPGRLHHAGPVRRLAVRPRPRRCRRLNNLADKQYETAFGYNQPGRALYATLRWQPK